VPEVEDDSIRELIFQNYRTVYSTRHPNEVVILAVVHGAMDLGRLSDREDWDIT
jgi:plasmid stabilization system protein ParE